jgi:hypothetical protein
VFWISARICCNSVLYGELHRIFPSSEKFNPCPISTILPSRAVPLSNCAPIPIVFQCGASLISNIAPESTIVENNHKSRGRSISFAPQVLLRAVRLRHHPTSSSYVIILCHHLIPYVIILTESDLCIQGRDEKLITIGNTPVFPQSLIPTSERQVPIPQAVNLIRLIRFDSTRFLFQVINFDL